MNETRPFTASHALIIGIDRYLHGIPPLRNAVRDARAITALLEQGHGYDVELLVDAGREEILQALDDIAAKTKADDRLLFYFAGHGIAPEDESGIHGYLIPGDARKVIGGANLLSMDLLQERISRLPCRHMLLILDCCYAGAFRWARTRHADLLPETVFSEHYLRYVRDPAWQVLTSASHDQRALDALWGLGRRQGGEHSPFARAFLDGLRGEADWLPPGGDGLITIGELAEYIRHRVELEALEARQRQTPALLYLDRHDKGQYVFEVPGKEMNLRPAPDLTEAANPYRGLRPFEADHEELFFGREQLLGELLDRVKSQKLSVLVGASGTGKSSLVRAGLVPRIRRDLDWEIIGPFRPSALPVDALATELGMPSFEPQSKTSERIEALVQHLVKRAVPLLVIVDQLEELVTLAESGAQSAAFLEILRRALELDDLRILVTVRSDFEPHFTQPSSTLAPSWQESRLVVSPFSHDDLHQVILGPASRRVLFFEDGLVERLVEEVLLEPGGLPLLSFTLWLLYESYVESERGDRCLNHDDLADLGGVAGAVRQRAEQVLEQLDALDPEALATLRRVMLRMVALRGGEPTRRQVPMNELDFSDAAENIRVKKVLGHLQEARLIVPDLDPAGQPFVEPAHDRLITAWPRLRIWLDAEDVDLPLQRWITQVSTDWDVRGRPEGLLTPNDPRIQNLLLLTPQAPHWLNEREHAFMAASEETRLWVEREKERRRRIIWVSIIIVTIASLLAAWRFDIQRREAVEANFRSIAQSLAIQSEVARGENDHELARLLAAQAFKFHSEHQGSHLAPIDAALRHSLSDGFTGFSLWEDAGEEIHGLTFHHRRLAAGVGAQIFLWDLDAAGKAPEIWGEADIFRVEQLAFSADGEKLVSYARDPHHRTAPRLSVWDLAGPRSERLLISQPSLEGFAVRPTPPFLVVALMCYGESSALLPITLAPSGEPLLMPEVPVPDGDLSELAWSPDGQSLAGASLMGTLYRWQFSDPASQPISEVLVSRSDLGFSSLLWGASDVLLAGSHEGRILTWNLTQKNGSVEDFGSDSIADLARHPYRDLLAIGFEDEMIRLYSGSAAAPLQVLAGHNHPVVSLAWSTDGQYLASGDSEGVLRLWESERAVDHQVLETHRSVMTVEFEPVNGSLLAASTGGGGLVVWPVTEGEIDIENKKESPDADGENWLHGTTFAPNGGTIFSAVEPPGVALVARDAATLEVRRFLPLSAMWSHLDVSADGKILAASNEADTRVIFLRLDQDDPLPTPFRDHRGNIWATAFHPTDPVIAIAGQESVNLWQLDGPDTVTAKRLELYSMRDMALSVAWSPDGNRLAAGSGGAFTGEVWLWDMKRPERIPIRLQGAEGALYAVEFNHDGRSLAAGGADGKVYIWDLEHPQAPAVELPGPRADIRSLSWHPSRPLLASGPDGTKVHVWVTDAGQLASSACQRVRRNLTWEEWTLAIGAEIPYELTCDKELGAHESVYEAARRMAREGDLPGGEELLGRVLGLDGRTDLDPRVETRRAFLVARGLERARTGSFEEAIRDLEEVDARWHGTSFSEWDAVCLQGCLQGEARRVLGACHRAVDMEPDSGEHRAIRGLALGLTGDKEAALRDLRWVMQHQPESPRAYNAQTWIERLESGDELLTDLDRRTLGGWW